MKEAAGEANMTVITIVLIAIVLGVGTLIVTNLMSNSSKSSACASAGGTWQNSKCYAANSCEYKEGKTVCSGTTLTCTKATTGEEKGNYICQ